MIAALLALSVLGAAPHTVQLVTTSTDTALVARIRAELLASGLSVGALGGDILVSVDRHGVDVSARGDAPARLTARDGAVLALKVAEHVRTVGAGPVHEPPRGHRVMAQPRLTPTSDEDVETRSAFSLELGARVMLDIGSGATAQPTLIARGRVALSPTFSAGLDLVVPTVGARLDAREGTVSLFPAALTGGVDAVHRFGPHVLGRVGAAAGVAPVLISGQPTAPFLGRTELLASAVFELRGAVGLELGAVAAWLELAVAWDAPRPLVEVGGRALGALGQPSLSAGLLVVL